MQIDSLRVKPALFQAGKPDVHCTAWLNTQKWSMSIGPTRFFCRSTRHGESIADGREPIGAISAGEEIGDRRDGGGLSRHLHQNRPGRRAQAVVGGAIE